jgi:hypothetical protein
MTIMTIEWAFKLREQLKGDKTKSFNHRRIIANILWGKYDKYKEDGVEIATSDVEFLDNQE